MQCNGYRTTLFNKMIHRCMREIQITSRLPYELPLKRSEQCCSTYDAARSGTQQQGKFPQVSGEKGCPKPKPWVPMFCALRLTQC